MSVVTFLYFDLIRLRVKLRRTRRQGLIPRCLHWFLSPEPALGFIPYDSNLSFLFQRIIRKFKIYELYFFSKCNLPASYDHQIRFLNQHYHYFNITDRLKVGDSSLRSEWQAFRELEGRMGWLEAVPPTTPSSKTQVSVILSETKWSEESPSNFIYFPFNNVILKYIVPFLIYEYICSL